MARRKVIIDQDAFGPGGSNLQAILMVLQSPEFDVLGITIESGDGWQRENVAHALRMLELTGRTDVPVIPGATYPLINTQERTRRWEKLHGPLPYKGAWMETWPGYNTVHRPRHHPPDVVPPLPEGEPTTTPAPEIAASFLVRMVRAHPGDVTILALGPMTNLALAARLDPEFARNACELIFMGGAFTPRARIADEFTLQFIHSPRVEFNLRWDPEAAHITLHAGWRAITCVPLDASVNTQLGTKLVQRATAGCAPGVKGAAGYLAQFARPDFPMWDEVAAAILLDPSIATVKTRLAMDVVIDHGAGYGATLSWPPGGGPGLGEPDVTVVEDIDVSRFEALFVELMRHPA